VKVFISWSGEPSRTVARALREWLPMVVQHVEPWMSDEEIGSGARWSDAIAKSLDETNFGIVCVTRANQHVPWLIFEAGALAKGVEQARVVPLCIDLSFSELTGPLTAFQGRGLDSDGVRRLVQDISAASEKSITAEQMATVFDAMWPRLEAAVAEAIDAVPPDTEPRRSAEDMLEELVERVRRIDRQAGGDKIPIGPIYFTKDYVHDGLLRKKTYPRGRRAVVLREHEHLGEVTHVDLRLPDGDFLREVPIDYISTLD
jgi:lambda repressor-like predicted transcriptional regulator